LDSPHHISLHYVAVKTVRQNDLKHKPKANKNTEGLKRKICFWLMFASILKLFLYKSVRTILLQTFLKKWST